jgi:hypothetical protein
MENDKDIKIETDEEVELDRSRKKRRMSFRLSLFINQYNISFNMFPYTYQLYANRCKI